MRMLVSFHRWAWLKSFGLDTGSPSWKYVVYATACVYKELYGKITDRKKKLA